jgi:ribosome maturation factor RimP
MDRSAVTQRIWELAEPVALAAGLELVDVQYRSESGRMILRLLLDRPEGGVTLEEITRASRELGDVLDAHDPIPGHYQLECSSPGLNRPLVREAHFARAVGKQVRVRTREPLNSRRQFRGRLDAVTVEGVTIVEQGDVSSFVPFAAIERANIEYEFPRTGGPARAHA